MRPYKARRRKTKSIAVKSSDAVNQRIPSQPSRILDAPDLVDDYYLNLIRWSKDNNYSWGHCCCGRFFDLGSFDWWIVRGQKEQCADWKYQRWPRDRHLWLPQPSSALWYCWCHQDMSVVLKLVARILLKIIFKPLSLVHLLIFPIVEIMQIPQLVCKENDILCWRESFYVFWHVTL
jgi:hypothetical protein